MLRTPHLLRQLCGAIALAIFGPFGIMPASGAEKVLYSFQGGSDGADPYGGLIADNADNLYGVTGNGGGGTACQLGCGTLFKLAPNRAETVLHSFAGGDEGAVPVGALVADRAGNLYGTTTEQGADSYGTVFEFSASGTESVLYAFKGGSDGVYPVGNLLIDHGGNLYGATLEGGSYYNSECSSGCGTVFRISPNGTKTILYTFQGGNDGSAPDAGLTMDTSGNLYGTTFGGGAGNPQNCDNPPRGCGTVFKIAPNGAESIVYAFQGGSGGFWPNGRLTMDGAGNLYGTTISGGGATNCQYGCGTVFRIAPNRTETILYTFQGGNDGDAPEAGPVMDKSGNLYGTTSGGGGAGCHTRPSGCGTVYKLAPDGTETVLSTFGAKHGRNPDSALLIGRHDLLYGIAPTGGTDDDGVVFSVRE